MAPTSVLIAMGTMVVVSAALTVGLVLLLRRSALWVSKVFALVGTAMLITHAFVLNGSPVLASFVGSPDAIVWSNFSPLFVAVLASGVWKSMTIPWQRYLAVSALAGVCVFQAYGPLFGSVPRTMAPPITAGGVHRQSTLSTCSAAAAATLLGRYDIPTTESEMAELCLTREGGTYQLGLYRGLRLKAPAARIEFLNHDFDAVTTSPQPVLVSIGVAARETVNINPLLRRVGHSVVIFGRLPDDRLVVGDPVSGRSAMTVDEFRNVWTGEAVRFAEAPKRP